MTVNGSITNDRALEIISGRMAMCSKAAGKTTAEMAEGSKNIEMGTNTRESGWMM